ncbi:hypothetical protein RCJ22_20465 [Vibrio sp. FNV 38]|nr:hypothetical protein [Vibrio sp. FNV 38]
MVTLVKTLAHVKVDNSGALIDVPVLLTEQGVFTPFSTIFSTNLFLKASHG